MPGSTYSKTSLQIINGKPTKDLNKSFSKNAQQTLRPNGENNFITFSYQESDTVFHEVFNEKGEIVSLQFHHVSFSHPPSINKHFQKSEYKKITSINFYGPMDLNWTIKLINFISKNNAVQMKLNFYHGALTGAPTILDEHIKSTNCSNVRALKIAFEPKQIEKYENGDEDPKLKNIIRNIQSFFEKAPVWFPNLENVHLDIPYDAKLKKSLEDDFFAHFKDLHLNGTYTQELFNQLIKFTSPHPQSKSTQSQKRRNKSIKKEANVDDFPVYFSKSSPNNEDNFNINTSSPESNGSSSTMLFGEDSVFDYEILHSPESNLEQTGENDIIDLDKNTRSQDVHFVADDPRFLSEAYKNAILKKNLDEKTKQNEENCTPPVSETHQSTLSPISPTPLIESFEFLRRPQKQIKVEPASPKNLNKKSKAHKEKQAHITPLSLVINGETSSNSKSHIIEVESENQPKKTICSSTMNKNYWENSTNSSSSPSSSISSDSGNKQFYGEKEFKIDYNLNQKNKNSFKHPKRHFSSDYNKENKRNEPEANKRRRVEKYSY